MGMPMELNWLIVTKGNEERINEGNLYSLEKEGYRLYPLDIPINIARTKTSKPLGTAVIKKLQWEAGLTRIEYDLTKLDTVN